MGSLDRSKKRIHLWKKAALHFSLCFVTGFFSGFAPTGTASIFFPNQPIINNPHIPSEPVESLPNPVNLRTLNRSLISEFPLTKKRHLLIVVTTTRSGDRFQEAFLTRLAHTLRLVAPPILWIVVEAHADAPKTAELLRRTGIMYRHLTFKGNFTEAGAEDDYQRNVALNHIEYHRLNGIVHFAGMWNTYDLHFFEEIRDIEVFGAWPVAMVSSNRKRVVVEGPICRSSKVAGWQRKVFGNGGAAADRRTPSRINLSGIAFNSSILWDPERWGRSSSVPDTSQDSIKFVQEVVLEDETKLRAIPSDCSRIMTWHLHVPRGRGPSKG